MTEEPLGRGVGKEINSAKEEPTDETLFCTGPAKEEEEKRKQLMNIINNTDVAVDNTGKLKMFYNGDEK